MNTELAVIEWLEDRFGKVENIGNMLGFFEVADTIEAHIPEFLPISRWQALKLLFSPKPQISLDDMVEGALGKIRDLHDRKKLSTIKYEITFKASSGRGTSNSQIEDFKDACRLCYHEIACIEKRGSNKVWVYTYVDFSKQLSNILANRYNCDVNEIR